MNNRTLQSMQEKNRLIRDQAGKITELEKQLSESVPRSRYNVVCGEVETAEKNLKELRVTFHSELEKLPTWETVKKACKTPDDAFDCSAEYCVPENGCPLVSGVISVKEGRQ